jgi:LytS/YehU family sensor histidine kinase
MALTSLLYLLLRRLDHKAIGTLVATAFLASFPVAVGYGVTNYTAFYVIKPLDSDMHAMQKHPEEPKLSPALEALDYALSWYFFIAAAAVLYVALAYAYRGRDAERSAALYRAEAHSAQLRALRYQINPHFLFNTLNSLSTLVLRHRNDEAERMIMNLSTFFRTSLATDPTDDVPLAEEIRMQRLYLAIEQVRFPERLSVVVDVPAELETVPVPGMILQPIVENAIKYAVAPSIQPVMLAIRARADGDRMRLTVEDDGRGGHADIKAGTGVGLRNVCDRLLARFRDRAECSYGRRPEGGFRVELAMPLAG